VESVERRYDLEGVARWDVVEGSKVTAEKVEAAPEIVTETPADEVVEEPKKPARRTRAKKAAEPEVED